MAGMTATNDGERIYALDIDQIRQVLKGTIADNLTFIGDNGSAHALSVYNPHTNGLGLIVKKSDGVTTLLDVRDSGITLNASVSAPLLQKGPVYDVTAFGADKTGAVASDAAIATAIAAMPSTGGVLYFPVGVYTVNTPIAIAKPMIVMGDGQTMSVVSSTSATANVFSVTTAYPGQNWFRDLGIAKTVAGMPSTAGAGIEMNAAATAQCVAPYIERCYFANLYDSIRLWNPINARILGNSFAQCQHSDLQCDYPLTPFGAGDNMIAFNNFSNTNTSSQAAIRIIGGAGWLIALNKFLGYQLQISGELAGGRLNLTDLFIWNNSMESQPNTAACVFLSGSELMGMVKIDGNQMVIAKNGGAAINFPASPSFTFTVDTGTEVITASAAHGLVVGDRVYVSSSTTLPAPLAANTLYYVNTVPSATTFTLSATSGGATINLTTTGAGTHTFYQVTYNDVTICNNTIQATGSGSVGIAVAPGVDDVSIGGNTILIASGATGIATSSPMKIRQTSPNAVRGDGTYLSGSLTSAQAKGQRGTVGATTNAAEGGLFVTPSTAITYPEPFFAAPQVQITPTSAACVGGRFLSHVTSGGKWTGANVVLIGTSNAAALTAAYEARADG